MRVLGMIGGIGPESTVDYYKLLLQLYRERRPDGSAPQILINSLDLQKLVALIEAGRLDDLASVFAAELEKLARAGADFGLLSANTAHIVFDQVQQRVSIPLISILEATCAEAKTKGLRRVGLLGTRFTMEGSFYPKVFARAGIQLVRPSEQERPWIHERYMGELVKGVFLPETRAALLNVIERLKREENIDGLALAGTELPLILRDAHIEGVTLLDTTKIHVEAAVERILGGPALPHSSQEQA